jgi:hypothetical protein
VTVVIVRDAAVDDAEAIAAIYVQNGRHESLPPDVETAETWARAQGARFATLETWIGSALSMPFWEERMQYTRQEIVFRKEL